MVWEDIGLATPKGGPAMAECASFLPQCKMKMEANFCVLRPRPEEAAERGRIEGWTAGLTSALTVIARSDSDEAIQLFFITARKLDCFASLAMTDKQPKAFPRRDFARVVPIRLLPLG